MINMANKLRSLGKLTHKAVGNGHAGIFCTEDLAMLLQVKASESFKKYLYKAVKAGVLDKVAVGLYYNPVAGFKAQGVLEYIARLLHWRHFIYISLESQLSHLGRISQIPMKRLTVMTTGRTRNVKTPFGIIEFTHTNRDPDQLKKDIYFDPNVSMFRAYEIRALTDLKRVGRNTHMLTAGDIDA